MGGRLDATNVLDAGVAAITNVQLDHQRCLGRTLAAIGTEKAAIIKRGNLAVTGATGRGLRAHRRALRGSSACRSPWPGRGGHIAPPCARPAGTGCWSTCARPDGVLRDLRIGLLGSHQAGNAAVALALLDALRADASAAGRAARRDHGAPPSGAGLRDVRWPGPAGAAAGHALRRVLLDGAHNPAGARALARALGELGMRRFPLVFGAMRGKRVPAVLRALAALDPIAGLHARRGSRRPCATESCSTRWQRSWAESRARRGRCQAGTGAGGRSARLAGPAARGGRVALPRRRGACDAARRGGSGMIELRWGERTYVMGIINITPDSFSGDGLAPAGPRARTEIVGAALRPGTRLRGGRRGDPGRRRRIVAARAVLRRAPVRVRRAKRPRWPCRSWPPWPPSSATACMVSIDTTKGSVARAAVAAGATMVNDVWAGRRDPDTVAAAAEAGAYLVLMHNKELAEYPGGVFDEVVSWLRDSHRGRSRRRCRAGTADRRPGDRLRQDAGPFDRDAASAGRVQGGDGRAAAAGGHEPQAGHR